MNCQLPIADCRLRKILRVVVAFALLWLLFAALFRSDAGRAVLVRAINHAAGGKVQLSGAYGAWPLRGGLARFAVADAQGTWLVISNVTWQIKARDLTARPWRVRDLRADAVEMARLPVSSASTSSSTSAVPSFLLDHVEVHQFQPVSSWVAGKTLQLHLEAGVEHNDAGWVILAGGREARTDARLSVVVRSVRDVWDVGAQSTNLAWSVAGGALEPVAGQLQWRSEERRGRFHVAARYAGEPVWAEGALIRRPGGLSLPNLLLTADGVRARIALQRAGTWQGEGRITVQRDAAVARWLAGQWDGEGRAKVEWSGRDFKASGVLPFLHTPAGEWTSVKVELQRAGDAGLALNVAADQWQRAGAALLDDLHVRGVLHAEPPGWRVGVEGATAQAGPVALSLLAPFSVSSGSAGLAWSTARLAVATGELTTHGQLSTQVTVVATCSNIPLAALAWEAVGGAEGLLDGRLLVQGAADAPELQGSVHLRDLRLRQTGAGVVLTNANVQAGLRVAQGRAAAELTWSGWSAEPFRAAVELPVRWSLRPWQLSVPRDEPGRGSFRGLFDLARLERVWDLRGTRVRGHIEGALDLAGTLDHPVVQGRLALLDGEVDVPETGTSLRDIRLVLEGDREHLQVREGSARDGGAGRLALTGAMRFDPVQHFPLAARLQVTRAQLWQRGGSRALLEGALDLSGDLRLLLLSGQLKAPEVQIKLGRSKPKVPTLPITGRTVDAVVAVETNRPVDQKTRVKLDIKLKVPRSAEISGRGLNANWGADLQVRGRLLAPILTGSVQAERGYFLFMGRRFDLESAWVGLDGRSPPQPTLNLLANSRARDMTARLHVSGPVREPRLELTSDPAYPADEVLSRMLFGKSADSISAFQAVSLAHGLNVLRGRGSSLDVLDRSQSLLRVDQLELRQDAEQGTVSSVSVGKYIGRRVFVQGETALDGSSDIIAVEVDIAPSLTLQTEASPGIREGIGLKWRKDY